MQNSPQINYLRIGLVQLDIQWEQPAVNLRRIEKLILPIVNEIDVLVLPEGFTTGFSVKKVKTEDFNNSATINWMKKVVEEYHIAICGSLFVKDADEVFNRFVWIDDEQIVTYDKRHLFSIGGENDNFSAGENRSLIEFRGWKIFPQICYDLRFPIWSRNNLQYDLLINVANWPAARNKVWKTLLKARAIENQSYVVGVNRVGEDGLRVAYKGNSLAIDAKGETISKAGNKEQVNIVKLDLEKLKAFRKKFNTLVDADAFSID